MAAIAHHIYDFPSDASYASALSAIQSIAPEKATWMSVSLIAHFRVTDTLSMPCIQDICCSLGTGSGTGRAYTQGFDPTITNALMFSGIMFQSLVLGSEPVYDVSNRIFVVISFDRLDVLLVLDPGLQQCVSIDISDSSYEFRNPSIRPRMFTPR